jgi:hypothetical protein
MQPIKRGTVVEIGVYMGRSLSYIMPQCAQNSNIIYAVDNWVGTRAQSADPRAGSAVMTLFLDWLQSHADRHCVRVLHMSSAEAANSFGPSTIDLVMIDGDHSYEGVISDLRTWVPKLHPNGILCGHDLHMSGVTDALRDYGVEISGRAGKSFWWSSGRKRR